MLGFSVLPLGLSFFTFVVSIGFLFFAGAKIFKIHFFYILIEFKIFSLLRIFSDFFTKNFSFLIISAKILQKFFIKITKFSFNFNLIKNRKKILQKFLLKFSEFLSKKFENFCDFCLNLPKTDHFPHILGIKRKRNKNSYQSKLANGKASIFFCLMFNVIFF